MNPFPCSFPAHFFLVSICTSVITYAVCEYIHVYIIVLKYTIFLKSVNKKTNANLIKQKGRRKQKIQGKIKYPQQQRKYLNEIIYTILCQILNRQM